MFEKLEDVRANAQAALEQIANTDDLNEWFGQYIGRRGEITLLLRETGKLPAEDRPAFGKQANAIKGQLEQAYNQRVELVQQQEMARDLEEGEIDVTLPGRPNPTGGLHPVTQTHRRFYEVWGDMGFQVYRSREVETDDVNFTLLNIPPHHPARDMQDTFFTEDEGIVLRTHTSPGQIRSMRDLGADGTQPIRVILPGMVFRYEQVTARSEMQFTQVEGLAIGRNIRMSDLKGTIAEFARRFFGENAAVRFRASYFPFTEPSMEIDINCFLCDGEGCNVCKYTGWLEIGGSGMVHPVVLKNGGYDPSEWSGFAFGLGPERSTMIKHGINDIRYFWGNDLRFLEQF